AGDPTIMAERRRAVSPATLAEHLRLTNFGTTTANLTVWAQVGTDLAGIDAVRSGRLVPPVPPARHDGELRWEGDHITVSLRCSPDPDTAGTGAAGAELGWHVTLPPGGSFLIDLAARCTQPRSATFTQTAAPPGPLWTIPDLPADRHDLLAANLADLEALLLADPDEPADRFAAAGAPWYLTLFGRDALWTAWLLLPLGTGLAAGTLRALARRQGDRHDPETEQAPGKILHEARSGPAHYGDLRLPPVYYGTIDATALWVRLLHDAWRAGLPEAEVAALLPNLVAALGWLTGPDADPDGDGLIEYAGSAHGGLANQGWKDSADGIRHADGGRARPPLALCEVQGYAHAAAVRAAALAEAFGLPDGPGWLDWAARLRDRFRASFWLRDEVGPYPAIALDAAKRPVSGASSNMAHLLGTGLLDPREAARVADRLAAPDLTTRFGLRTLTTTSAAYNPLSYHCGSVWPHDTAIAVAGLLAEGRAEQATSLAEGLLRAAAHFDGRPPELYGVLDDGPPVRYPSACHPQAWAAAAMVAAVLVS
ncbi:MGH1-like glycoside hydrolase domain-containing protein, partial [Actinophytocola sp.]|uniref:MGH1-like glycoside hydrolase domain-containing protein n=1 Tax=Actinophytocola sp. TaxID=1872138 RepID=UPI002D80ECB5